ncbi:hypothetical protein [Roseimaritima sediminicola]|nr:hypothetical protein [Roseimaritima sediminicola]
MDARIAPMDARIVPMDANRIRQTLPATNRRSVLTAEAWRQ